MGLTFGVLFSSLDIFLDLLLLRIVRIPLEQFFPSLDRAFWIAFALPPNYSQVEQRSGVIWPIFQGLLKRRNGSIGISGVPLRSAQVGQQVRVLWLTLLRQFVVLNGIRKLLAVVIQIRHFHNRIEVLGIRFQSGKQRGDSLINHGLLLFWS